MTPCRVLVIEDHFDTAEAIAIWLRMAGHSVELAPDGETGLAIARRLHPQVVLCDIRLPGVDGYYVARSLRQDPTAPGCYFVAISGLEHRSALIDVGIDEYLLKPILPETLLAMMGRAVGRAG